MNDFLIQEYIKRLSLNDIINFAKKEGITINEEEANILYSELIENWRTIVHGNARVVLDRLKKNLDDEVYCKIEQLYMKFRDRLH